MASCGTPTEDAAHEQQADTTAPRTAILPSGTRAAVTANEISVPSIDEIHAIVATDTATWVAGTGPRISLGNLAPNGALVRVDSDGSLSAAFPTGTDPGALAVTAQREWVVNGLYDKSTPRVGADSVWEYAPDGKLLSRYAVPGVGGVYGYGGVLAFGTRAFTVSTRGRRLIVTELHDHRQRSTDALTVGAQFGDVAAAPCPSGGVAAVELDHDRTLVLAVSPEGKITAHAEITRSGVPHLACDADGVFLKAGNVQDGVVTIKFDPGLQTQTNINTPMAGELAASGHQLWTVSVGGDDNTTVREVRTDGTTVNSREISGPVSFCSADDSQL
jgi:hypothetical protein